MEVAYFLDFLTLQLLTIIWANGDGLLSKSLHSAHGTGHSAWMYLLSLKFTCKVQPVLLSDTCRLHVMFTVADGAGGRSVSSYN